MRELHVFLCKLQECSDERIMPLLSSLVCCVFDHLITTFVHSRYDYSLYFLSKQKILTKHFLTKKKNELNIAATQNL